MAVITNHSNLIQSPNKIYGIDNKLNYKQNINFCGIEKIKLKDSYFKDFKNWVIVKNFDSTVGCLTATTAVAGFGIGGAGLIYDSMVKKAKNKGQVKDSNSEEKGVPVPPAIPLTESANPTASSKNNLNFSSLLYKAKEEAKQGYNLISFNSKYSAKKKEEKSHEGEYGYIVPETEFGKLGLALAKTTLVVSGFAGFLTGLALRMPLMCAGEVIGNVLAAPIITTPAGYGVMSLGMAFLLSGRALENRPDLKLNTAIVAHQKGLGGKIKYVMQNMGAGLNETKNTLKEVISHAAHLASSNKQVRNEANHFLKNYLFRIRSSTVTLKQNIIANGESIVESGIKTYPHRLHAFAGIMAASGVIMIAEDLLERAGVIKNKETRKTCFNVAKSGQYAQNVSVVTYGLERTVKGAPILGVPAVISGAMSLVGAPNVDKDEGKGIIWFSMSFFFMLLAMERAIEAGLAIRNRKNLKLKPMMDEFSDFAKLFELDFSKAGNLTNKQLDNILKVVGGREKAMLRIKQLFSKKAGEKAALKMEEEVKLAIKELENDSNPVLKEFPRFIKEGILSGFYKPGFSEADLIKELEKRNFSKEFVEYIRKNIKITSKISEAQDIQNLMNRIHEKNAKLFGQNYLPKLNEIINNPKKYPDWAVEAARKAKVDFADLLQKN